MPETRSAGLLAFLLALPSLAVVVPPAAEAAATASAPQAGPTVPSAPADAGSEPGETLDARLRRLSDAIRSQTDQLGESEREGMEGEPWVAAGAWGNGKGRGWANRGWTNRAYGNSYYGRPVWANYRPGWSNFGNAPRGFLNW